MESRLHGQDEQIKELEGALESKVKDYNNVQSLFDKSEGKLHAHFFLWSKKLENSSTLIKTIDRRKEIESLINRMTIQINNFTLITKT